MRKSYQDLQYNTYTMLKDYYTFEEIGQFPLRYLFDQLKYFEPKLKEIAEMQRQEQLKSELTGQKNRNGPRR